MATVTDTWNDIVAWLSEHAPGTAAKLGSPEPSALAAVSNHLGQELPSELAEYVSVVPDSGYQDLFGPHFLLPASAVVSESQMRAGIYTAELFDEEEEVGPAGQWSHTWPPEFLALTSDSMGGALFVDLREGELRGCVTRWDKVDGSVLPNPPHWTTVTELLADVLAALEGGGLFMTWYAPQVDEQGYLHWDFVS